MIQPQHQVIINYAQSYDVTFKVVNGSWDDDTTINRVVTLNGNAGETLKLSSGQIPAVGSKPNDGYKAGSWSPSTPTDETVIKMTDFKILMFHKVD